MPRSRVKGICSVNPKPLITKSSQGSSNVNFKTTPNCGRVRGQDVNRLDEIEIAVSLDSNEQAPELKVLQIARRLELLLTFLVGKRTVIQPYRYVTIDENEKEQGEFTPRLKLKALPSPYLLDVDLSKPEIDRLLFSDGKMEPVRRQLNNYLDGCQNHLINQVLGFYKVIEKNGKPTEKEKALRDMLSHSKITHHNTVAAAKRYFDSDEISSADPKKIEKAMYELEEHGRKIISSKLGISCPQVRFYELTNNRLVIGARHFS